MFDAIQHIDVDRKNSLPLADFSSRYQATSTPVVFGDMTHRWPAYRKWNLEFFRKQLGDYQIPAYSHKVATNGGNNNLPVTKVSADEYFELLLHDEDELQVRDLDFLKINRYLSEDFTIPRLGLKFKKNRARLHVGGSGSMERMHYRADLAESFLCNFGGRQQVLLVRPEQAKFTYEPPYSFESLPTVDYTKNGLKNNPAISNINAYYAQLDHGDVLYIPSGYRYSIHYPTISFGMLLTAPPHSIKKKIKAKYNTLFVAPFDYLGHRVFGKRWLRRKVRKAVRRSRT